ncbi:MAG: glucosaminidase domain-containing protein [Chloroflexota bacterium]
MGPAAIGLLALCTSVAAVHTARQTSLAAVVSTAIDGLSSQQVHAPETFDPADTPAVDRAAAFILDPASRDSRSIERTPRIAPVEPFTYSVRAGDTLDGIAARFGIPISALLWNNNLADAEQQVVAVGQRLTLLPVGGVLHVTRDGESLQQIAARYRTSADLVARANALTPHSIPEDGRVIVVLGGLAPTAAEVTTDDSVSSSAVTAADEPLPEPTNTTEDERAFILTVAPGARHSQRGTGVPASVTLAQAILESNWGRSRLATEARNLFGIKAFTRPGTDGVYAANTWEVYRGASVITREIFKAYKTIDDSIVDHGLWFIEQPRYAGALRVADDPRAFAYAINAAGYATDPAYAPKLIWLMNQHNLFAFDVPPGDRRAQSSP